MSFYQTFAFKTIIHGESSTPSSIVLGFLNFSLPTILANYLDFGIEKKFRSHSASDDPPEFPSFASWKTNTKPYLMPKNSDTFETSHEPMIATCTDKKNICLRCNFFQTAYAIYLHCSQKGETTSWKLFLIVRPFTLLKKLYRL